MKITPTPDTLTKLFALLEKKYHIPSYQRNYSWRAAQLEQLVEDIWTSYAAKDSYFMGTLVLNDDDSNPNIIEIVDGQQRLATFSIFVAVCRQFFNLFLQDPGNEIFNELRDKTSQRKLAENGKDLSNRILKNTDNEGHLILNTKDDQHFRQIVEEELPVSNVEPQRNERLIIKARKFLTSEVIEKCLAKRNGIEDLYELLKHVTSRLLFFAIRVGGDGDAYLLFESLNSKGMDLAATDLLKNRILMLCDGNEQKKTSMLAMWDELIASMERSRLSVVDFIRIYWIAYHEKTTKKELYKKVRSYLSKSNVEKEMQQIVSVAKYFAEITDVDLVFPSSNYGKDLTKKAYAELNTLRYSLCYPLLLRVHSSFPTLETKIARLAADVLFRVITVGGKSAGKVDTKFEELLSKVRDGKQLSWNDFLTTLKNVDEDTERLKSLIRTTRFEDTKSAKYFWAKIFDYEGTGGLVLNFKTLHLEHVLPQSFDSHWSDFDPGPNKSVEDWVHSIGNLAILEAPINQSVSNKPFNTKKMHFAKKDSPEGGGTDIPQTSAISKISKWTSKEIGERAKKAADSFAKIWPEVVGR